MTSGYAAYSPAKGKHKKAPLLVQRRGFLAPGVLLKAEGPVWSAEDQAMKVSAVSAVKSVPTN